MVLEYEELLACTVERDESLFCFRSQDGNVAAVQGGALLGFCGALDEARAFGFPIQWNTIAVAL